MQAFTSCLQTTEIFLELSAKKGKMIPTINDFRKMPGSFQMLRNTNRKKFYWKKPMGKFCEVQNFKHGTETRKSTFVRLKIISFDIQIKKRWVMTQMRLKLILRNGYLGLNDYGKGYGQWLVQTCNQSLASTTWYHTFDPDMGIWVPVPSSYFGHYPIFNTPKSFRRKDSQYDKIMFPLCCATLKMLFNYKKKGKNIIKK